MKRLLLGFAVLVVVLGAGAAVSMRGGWDRMESACSEGPSAMVGLIHPATASPVDSPTAARARPCRGCSRSPVSLVDALVGQRFRGHPQHSIGPCRCLRGAGSIEHRFNQYSTLTGSAGITRSASSQARCVGHRGTAPADRCPAPIHWAAREE